MAGTAVLRVVPRPTLDPTVPTSGVEASAAVPLVTGLPVGVDTATITVIVLPLLFAVGVLVAPVVANRHLRDTRSPSEDESETLASLGTDAGRPPGRAYVVETVGDASVDVAIRGPPGLRTLFVTDYVLTDLDESVARALLAAEIGRTSVYYDEVKAVAIGVVFSILAATFTVPALAFDAGLALMGVFALVAFGVGRRLQFLADRRAARRVGAGRLADAFEHVADLHGVEPETSTWRTYFEIQPPLGDRIAALRARGAEEFE